MSSKYLLPCSCGKQNIVQTSQAGDQIVCECGEKLGVPTLSQLRSLSPADAEPAAKESFSWGPLQGLLLCGAVVLLVGLSMAGYFYANRPLPFVLDEGHVESSMQQYEENMSLTKSWVDWVDLRDNGLGESVLITVLDYEIAKKHHDRKMWIAFAITCVGLILLLSGLIASFSRSTSQSNTSR